jgi:hypothetical protein
VVLGWVLVVGGVVGWLGVVVTHMSADLLGRLTELDIDAASDGRSFEL